jgi:hypothetical protein
MMEQHYATDWLFDRGIDFIEQHASSDKPFALMLSIPGERVTCHYIDIYINSITLSSFEHIIVWCA